MAGLARFALEMNITRRALGALLGAGLICAAAGQAAAQDYPNRFVTMIVGFGAGGATDLLGRLAAQQLSDKLGVPVPVENKAGANMALASRQVKDGPADGYTLLVGASAMISNLYGMKDPGYRMEDFTVIGGYGYSPFMLYVNSNRTGAKTLKELVDYGKKNPGNLTYGSIGPASPSNLASQRLEGQAKLGWVEVPFKSGADATTAAMGGTIDAYFGDLTFWNTVKGRAGMVAVAITGAERHPLFPDVPTFKELGYDVMDGFSFGILVKAGTPQPVVDKLRKAFEDAKKIPQTGEKLGAIGLSVYPGSADDYQKEIDRQSATFKADFAKLGIQPQ